MSRYVVVFEGDDENGYSAYSPDLPGVAVVGPTAAETEQLMRKAMAEHVAMLREADQSAPEPAKATHPLIAVRPGQQDELGNVNPIIGRDHGDEALACG